MCAALTASRVSKNYFNPLLTAEPRSAEIMCSLMCLPCLMNLGERSENHAQYLSQELGKRR